MSRSRQDDGDVRGIAIGFTQGHLWRDHSSGWGQLVWASGVMTVEAMQRLWIVPRHQAIWVPANVKHTVELSGRGSSQRVYLRRSWCRPLSPVTTVVPVTALLRELLKRILQVGPLHATRSRDVTLLRLLRDELRGQAVATLDLTLPVDPRARRAADLMRGPPRESLDLARLGRRVGASRRTLERLFRAETGMSIGVWRQRARLLHAVTLLANGRSVTAAGLAAGYAGTSAFIAAFKRATGLTPRQYLLLG